MEDNKNEFFKLTMKDMLTTPCAEICYELGTYFVGQRDYAEAVLWFYNAAYETESILDVHTSGIFRCSVSSNVTRRSSPGRKPKFLPTQRLPSSMK